MKPRAKKPKMVPLQALENAVEKLVAEERRRYFELAAADGLIWKLGMYAAFVTVGALVLAAYLVLR